MANPTLVPIAKTIWGLRGLIEISRRQVCIRIAVKQTLFYPVVTAVVLFSGCTLSASEFSAPSAAGTSQSATAPAAATPETPDTAAVSSDEVAQLQGMVDAIHQQVNDFRRSQGLDPLTLEPAISAEALRHSEAMAQSGTLSHSGFEDRIDRLSQTLSLRSAAENVAFNFGHSDPASQAVSGWIDSPGHYMNMVGNFSTTGIGVFQDDQGRYYFTQIFWRS